MRDLLGRKGQMPLHAIADELGENLETVRKPAQRGKGRTFLSDAGPDGIYGWCLLQVEG